MKNVGVQQILVAVVCNGVARSISGRSDGTRNPVGAQSSVCVKPGSEVEALRMNRRTKGMPALAERTIYLNELTPDLLMVYFEGVRRGRIFRAKCRIQSALARKSMRKHTR